MEKVRKNPRLMMYHLRNRTQEIKKSFECLQKVAAVALCVCTLFFMALGCEKQKTASGEDEEGENPFSSGNVTGDIIGAFFCGGIGLLLVQVDEKYPIGKTIKYEYAPYGCLQLPKTGTYRNMIQVQPYPHLPLSDFPETEVLNKKISFSYREYQRPEKGKDLGDYLLLIVGELRPVTGMCTPPEIPIHIITNCQILN